MRRRYERRSRDCAVAIVVVVGHMLLILLWERVSRQTEQTTASDSAFETTLRLLPAPVSTGNDRSDFSGPAPVLPSSPLPSISPPALPAIASLPPEAPAHTIDWRHEAERAARDATHAITQPQARSFGPKPRAPAGTAPKQFEWSPEPKTVGFSGLLPYVRLGKRCFLGLGFFGCAFGELPKANGALLEHMDDADRPVSSVPDVAPVPLP
jgi:hypothetical protein